MMMTNATFGYGGWSPTDYVRTGDPTAVTWAAIDHPVAISDGLTWGRQPLGSVICRSRRCPLTLE